MPLLLAAILSPLLAALVTVAVRGWKRGAVVAALSLLVSAGVLSVSIGRGLVERYDLERTLGLVVLEGNDFNLAFSLAISLLSAAAVLCAPSFLERSRRRGTPASFYALYLACAAALLATPLSGTLTTFFVFFEMYLVASWLLLLFWGGRSRGVAALTYLVFTEVGALLTLLGIAVVYDAYGTLSFEQLKAALASAPPADLALPLVLLAAGPLVKMAIVPFHAWLPSVYSSAPVPLLVTMTLAEGTGGWALVKLLVLTAPSVLNGAWFRRPFLILAALTAIYGSLSALAQKDARRLLAYSTVSQSGYMLLGIACGGRLAAASALLFFFSHSIAKAVLLTDFGYLEELSETSSLEGFGGLAPSMPATAVSTLVSFLSLAGVPPTLGFWAELEVLAGIVKLFLNSGVAGLAAAATLSASTVFSAAYGLLCFKRVFFGPPKVRLEEKLSEPVAVALTLSLVSVALGTYPALLLGALAQLP